MKELLSFEDKMLLKDNDERKKRIEHFLNFLFENARTTEDEQYVFEVRTLGRDKKVVSELWITDMLTDAAASILAIEKKFGRNLKGVYATINVVKNDKGMGDKETLKDEDITHIINFVIDIDIHTRALDPAERATLEAAITETVRNVFDGYKSLVSFSGFGFHVFVKLKPIEVNADEIKSAYKAVASRLAQNFIIELRKRLPEELKNVIEKPDLSVYNMSRIMRVAYTLNFREINNELHVSFSRVVYEQPGEYLDLTNDIKKEIEKMLNAREQMLINTKTKLTDDEIARLVDVISGAWTPGRRHHLALGLSAFLLWRGVDYESARAVIEKVIEKTHDTEKADRIRALDDTYHVSVLKAYRPHFRAAFESDEEINKFIYQLNNALKSYYERLGTGRESDIDSVTIAPAIVNDAFDLLTFLHEHVIDAIKEEDNKTGVKTYKLTVFDNEARKSGIIVFKDAARDFVKVFETINNQWFENFARFIVDKESMLLLEKEERKLFKVKVMQIIYRFMKDIVKNARTVVKDEFDDVREEFITIFEFSVKKILRIPSKNVLDSSTFAELLQKYKFVYDESSDKIYMHQSFFELSESPRSFSIKLAKLFYRLKIIDKEAFRYVRKFVRNGDIRHAYYELNKLKLLAFLDSEHVVYDVKDYDPTEVEIDGMEVIEE